MKMKEIREKMLENIGGCHKKCLIFQLLIAIEYQTWYQISAKI